MNSLGRAPYGARGLKYAHHQAQMWLCGGRAPYGARGLKSSRCISSDNGRRSRPVWGAWIEMICRKMKKPASFGRAPYGARGLKSRQQAARSTAVRGRAPYGARGLKCNKRRRRTRLCGSRPVWGAWIEIGSACVYRKQGPGRAPYGARGLKCRYHPPPG